MKTMADYVPAQLKEQANRNINQRRIFVPVQAVSTTTVDFGTLFEWSDHRFTFLK